MPQVSPTILRYDGLTIWFHWTVALLVMVLWLVAQVIDWFPKGMPRIEVRSIHIGLGLLLGVLLVARGVWRATRGRVLPPGDRGTLHVLAKSMHYTLYVLLFAMVLVGISLVWVRGDSFFGLFTVPAFDPGNKALRDNVEELHGTIATVILVLAGLHALASLIHHYLWHDNILQRMFPGRS